MKGITGEDLLEFVKTLEGVQVQGDFTVPLAGFCSLNRPKSGCLTWVKKPESGSLAAFAGCRDNVVVTPQILPSEVQGVRFLLTDQPKAVFFAVLSHFWGDRAEPVIASDATVETNHIGRGVSIGRHSYIGPDVVIEDGVIIGHNVSIVCPAVIGRNTRIHSGVVIGTDGYGYYQVEGVPQKVEHFGGVHIGENTEIGANACIDRGTIDDTEIGNNVKIDNLCHIAHNVVVEDNVMLVAGTILCGSTQVGRGSYLAPGVILRNQTRVGEHVFASLGTVVARNVKDNGVVLGQRPKYLRGPWEDLGIKL